MGRATKMTDADTTRTGRELTGRHVLFIFIAGFGIIIGVNVYMATEAVSTFPGLEVSSSYAAGQDFNERRDAQEALGWTSSVEVDEEAGLLTLHLTDADGAPVVPAEFTALLTRPTNQLEDQELDLTFADGVYTAPVQVSDGRWRLRMTGTAQDGTAYRRNITFSLPD